MSKKSKYPSYSSGSVTVNGKEVASTKKSGNKIDSSYNMTDAEKSIYDGIQSNLASSLNNLYSISDEKQEQWNKELEAYKKAGLKEINDIYTPMVNNLRDNIASRFGNLDNSVFMDNLDTITDKQAQAVSDFSNDLLTKQSELYSSEIANRLSFISLLGNLNSTMNSNMMNYMQMALANSESGNNYNQNAYQATNSNSGLFNSAIGAVGKLGSAALSYYTKAGSAAKAGSTVASTLK